MDTITLRYIEVFGPIAVAFLGLYFVWTQNKINKRIQDLGDYVAVSIVPRENFQLDVMNVGKINLYLHKWEAGVQTENFMEPVLIPAGTASFFKYFYKARKR